MFGTIGHARMKAGRQSQLESLMREWSQSIRPLVPGEFVQLVGHADGQPDELVFVALAQDKATYQRLSELPEQDAWFRRFADEIEGEVRREDVAKEMIPS